jgi:arabinofuranosyltransferase
MGIYLFHYLPDDTFITLRYARNVVRGYGFVFNHGVRLEGYTNFLWLIMVALAGELGAPLIASARYVGLLFSVAVLFLSFAAARMHSAGTSSAAWNDALASMLPPMLLASSAPFLVWSLSGTEMPLYTFLLLAGFVSIASNAKPAATFAIFGILGLVRPEGLTFYALAGFVILIRSRRRGTVLGAGLGVLIALYAPYLIWKYRYFGSIVPNTFYAKTGPFALMIKNGSGYFLKFFFSYGYLFVIGLLLNRKRLKKFEFVMLPAAFIIVHWISVILLGGDWMPHARFFLPTMPLIMLMLSSGVRGLRIETEASGSGRRAGNPVAVIAVLLVFLAMIPGFVRYDDFAAERTAVGAFSALGRHLHRILPPGTRIACGSTGAIGYYTDMPVIDILGLTEAHIARNGHIVASQPGHMKTDGEYVLQQQPDLLLLGNIQIHRGRRGIDEMRHKVQESEIIMQPGFVRDYEFVNIPLTGDFYLSCYKRKGYFLPLR